MRIERSTFLSLCFSIVPAVAIACGGSSDDDAANGNGLLSITVRGSSLFESTPHPSGFVQTFNFDVKHGGKKLQLGDVINAAGMAKELAQCIRTVDSAGPEGANAPADEDS